mmetsp:Transcript_19044/g.27115  ORF Transcript_19044/g.27115 Transcript_19044/m.27115 type:complete len:254 (-) Transcript_19044:48-809(-)
MLEIDIAIHHYNHQSSYLNHLVYAMVATFSLNQISEGLQSRHRSSLICRRSKQSSHRVFLQLHKYEIDCAETNIHERHSLSLIFFVPILQFFVGRRRPCRVYQIDQQVSLAPLHCASPGLYPKYHHRRHLFRHRCTRTRACWVVVLNANPLFFSVHRVIRFVPRRASLHNLENDVVASHHDRHSHRHENHNHLHFLPPRHRHCENSTLPSNDTQRKLHHPCRSSWDHIQCPSPIYLGIVHSFVLVPTLPYARD